MILSTRKKRKKGSEKKQNTGDREKSSIFFLSKICWNEMTKIKHVKKNTAMKIKCVYWQTKKMASQESVKR